MRNKSFVTSIILLPLFLLAVGGQNSGLRELTYVSLDGNNISNWMSNNGAFITQNYTRSAGLTWPAGTGNSVIYASGPWLIGKVNGDIRSASVEFQSELQPGRIVDGLPDDPSFTSNRIYKLDAGNTTSTDYLEWPGSEGAPIDAEGNPLLLGDQVAWWVANDANPQNHPLYHTEPLYVEAQTYVFVFDKPGIFQDMMVVDITYINHGEAIDSCYAAVWSDPDLGNAYDDFVGYDATLEMGYAWNDGVDQTWGKATPAVGCVLLRTPTQDGEEVGLRAFSKYINAGGDEWGDPETATSAYNFLQGLNAIGDPFIDPTTIEVTTFIHPGDPVTGTGWIDPMSHASGDRRFLMSAGPFDFAPGDTQRISFAYLIAQGLDNLNSITKLRTKALNLSTLMRDEIAADIHAPDLTQLTHEITLESAWITLDPTITEADLIWNLVSAPPENTADLIGTTEAICHFTPNAEGEYTISLTVTASTGQTTTVGAILQVVDNGPPHAELSTSASVIVWGDSLILDASGTTDPDEDVLNYQWECDDSWVLRDEGPEAAFLPLSTGEKSIDLFVTDQYYEDHLSGELLVIPRQEDLIYEYSLLDSNWLNQSFRPYFSGDTLLVPILSQNILRAYLLDEAGLVESHDINISDVYKIMAIHDEHLYTRRSSSLSIHEIGVDWAVNPILENYNGGGYNILFVDDLTLMWGNYSIQNMDFSTLSSPVEIGVHSFEDYQVMDLQNSDANIFALLLDRSVAYPYRYFVEALDKSTFARLGLMTLPADLRTIAVHENMMYVAAHSSDSLWIYNVESYDNPIQLFAGRVHALDYWPKYTLVAQLNYLGAGKLGVSTNCGVQIWDVTDPAAPMNTASWSDGLDYHSLIESGGNTYMVGETRWENVYQNGITKVSVGVVDRDESFSEIPLRFYLKQNYPNPFNPVTTIDFVLEQSADVSLTIYDIRGRTIASLEQGFLQRGKYQLQWDGTSDGGQQLSTGIYFCRLEAGDFSQTIKMVCLK